MKKIKKERKKYTPSFPVEITPLDLLAQKRLSVLLGIDSMTKVSSVKENDKL